MNPKKGPLVGMLSLSLMGCTVRPEASYKDLNPVKEQIIISDITTSEIKSIIDDFTKNIHGKDLFEGINVEDSRILKLVGEFGSRAELYLNIHLMISEIKNDRVLLHWFLKTYSDAFYIKNNRATITSLKERINLEDVIEYYKAYKELSKQITKDEALFVLYQNHRRYNIYRYATRYKPTTLIDQANKLPYLDMDPKKEQVIVISAKYDYNGAFDRLDMNYKHDTSGEIWFYETTSDSELFEIIDRVSINLPNKFTLVINGHGMPNNIELKNDNSIKGELSIEDIFKLKKYEGRIKKIILSACATGEGKYNLAYTVAAATKAEVYALISHTWIPQLEIKNGEIIIKHSSNQIAEYNYEDAINPKKTGEYSFLYSLISYPKNINDFKEFTKRISKIGKIQGQIIDEMIKYKELFEYVPLFANKIKGRVSDISLLKYYFKTKRNDDTLIKKRLLENYCDDVLIYLLQKGELNEKLSEIITKELVRRDKEKIKIKNSFIPEIEKIHAPREIYIYPYLHKH